MDTLAFLEQLTAQPTYRGQVAHIEHISPREARWAEIDEPLSASLQDCLDEHGLLPLYTHQAEAVNNSRQGKNVMVSTASASGPSLCYHIVVLESILAERSSSAL